jgi:murein L,D-transpeptidase YafK
MPASHRSALIAAIVCVIAALMLTQALAGEADGEVVTGEPAVADGTVSWETIVAQGFELVVHKAARRMEVISPRGDDGVAVRAWRIGLGFTPDGDKEMQGDGKTPEGSFRVTRRIPKSQYYKAFLISYPEVEDADRGQAAGLVSEATADSIRSAHAKGGVPNAYTSLGGLIEIHGLGGGSDWTLGCVAADNVVIDELWPYVKVGTRVRIKR